MILHSHMLYLIEILVKNDSYLLRNPAPLIFLLDHPGSICDDASSQFIIGQKEFYFLGNAIWISHLTE